MFLTTNYLNYFKDEELVIFQDIKPASKHHLLVVPREHLTDSKNLLPKHLPLVDKMVTTGERILREQLSKEDPSKDGEDLEGVPKLMGFHWPPFHTVSHLHLHVIAPTNQMGFLARTIFKPNSFWFVTVN